MSALLGRIGGATAAHPWRTICTWLVLVAAGLGLSAVIGGSPHDDFRVEGSPSQIGTDALVEQFPQWSGADARVVVHSRASEPLGGGVLASLVSRLTALPHVVVVTPPRLSQDRDTALIDVRYGVPVTYFSGSDGVDALRSATAATEHSGLEVELGGQLPENFSAPSGSAEAVGVIAALIILVISFGSVVAAGLPLAVAFAGIGLGFAGIGLLCTLMNVSTTAPTVASMVGLGVGIDYALLLVNRFTENLRRGLDTRAAAEAANATAGLSVVLAGTTVVVSLLGLKLTGLPTYVTFGYATLLVVIAVMLASITLVPALCSLAGSRVLPRRVRQATPVMPQVNMDRGTGHAEAATARPTAITRWAARVGGRPWPWAIFSALVLLLLAAPVLDMRMWPQDAGSQPESSTTRRSYDLVAAEFGPGANGPLLISAQVSQLGPQGIDGLAREVSSQPGVFAVSQPIFNATRSTVLISVQPTTGPQDERTPELLDRLRTSVIPPGSHITGLTAFYADISQRLSQRLWVVVAFVVAMSLLLLTGVFRSIVISVKAAVMNLLSVAAAYGVMVAIFQWGWGARLVGLPHAVPVTSWVPILMFAVLFGLSMDYEVFLLSRIREDWLATGDAHGSVVRGLAGTGRVISSAAAIMVAVFVGFALDPDVTVKMTGVGMAVAILIDATLVRLILVPATMALLGRANWWLPAWADRLLPNLDIEGGSRTVGALSEAGDRQPQSA